MEDISLPGGRLQGVADRAREDIAAGKTKPPGWDAERVRRLIAHYDALDEEQQVAEREDRDTNKPRFRFCHPRYPCWFRQHNGNGSCGGRNHSWRPSPLLHGLE